MPVSNNVVLWLRGGGLKDDCNSIDNGQKDNDEKNYADANNQSTSQRVSFSTTAASHNTSNRSQNHHTDFNNNFCSNNDSGLDSDSSNKYRRYSSHEVNFHSAPRGRSNGRGYYSNDVNYHHSPA
eukprot:10272143-Ditylum_brightwellii.AAC.1